MKARLESQKMSTTEGFSMTETRDNFRSTSPKSDKFNKSIRSKRNTSAARRNAPDLEISNKRQNTRYLVGQPRIVSPISDNHEAETLGSPDGLDNFGSFNFVKKKD